MATIQQVMEGIETRLDTIAGLRVSSYVADQINPPQAIVGVPPIPLYRTSFGSAGELQIAPTITILVSAALDRVGQMLLASYVDKSGPSSVFAAVDADKTLGLPGVDCSVVSFQPLGLADVGVLGYYGGVFTLNCLATG